jgi:hypothetical protein
MPRPTPNRSSLWIFALGALWLLRHRRGLETCRGGKSKWARLSPSQPSIGATPLPAVDETGGKIKILDLPIFPPCC